MTGFGDASEQVDGVHYAVEVRSLNNRYFKATVRLPEHIGGLESEVEALLRKRLARGSVAMTVRMHDATPDSAPRINSEVLQDYLSHLETLHGRLASEAPNIHIDLTSLLALPGVLDTGQDEQEMIDRARPVVAKLIQRACDKLMAMRSTEGQMLAEDMLKQRRAISALLEVIGQRAPEVIEEYHQRLRTRIDDLMARAQLQLEEKDLVREVAMFAEKADISEEVTRMAAHMEQFEQIIRDADGEPAGRTLDFLAQELLREANTIASKSNDARISKAIVEVKGSIDRIKEQVQNVE